MTSASWKRCTPASHPPCRAQAVCCDGWSIVFGVKYHWVPIACVQAMMSGLAEEPMRARVDGDRVRAVAGDERREPLGDLVHRRLASDVCETPVGHPLPHATDA